METISIGLTVYFEDGFWHGLFEQVYRESYQVCRVTFGQEPKESFFQVERTIAVAVRGKEKDFKTSI